MSTAPATRGPRRLIAVGALFTLAGLALAAASPVFGTEGSERTASQQLAGGLVVLAGWALLAWGIHRMGRADPE